MHAIHSSGMVCQGPVGDVIHSEGPSEDGFHEMGTPSPSYCCISPAPLPSSQSSLTACICCRGSGQGKKPGAALQWPTVPSQRGG